MDLFLFWFGRDDYVGMVMGMEWVLKVMLECWRCWQGRSWLAGFVEEERELVCGEGL